MGRPLLGSGRGRDDGPLLPPHHSPRRTPARTERRIIKVRVLRRWGPARIAHLLGLEAETAELLRNLLPRPDSRSVIVGSATPWTFPRDHEHRSSNSVVR